MAATVFLSAITTLAKHSPALSLYTRRYANSDPPIHQVGSYDMMINMDGAIDTHYQLCFNTSNLHNPRSKAEHGKGDMVTSVTVWELWMHIIKGECYGDYGEWIRLLYAAEDYIRRLMYLDKDASLS